ncbi:acyl-CoA carboxylase epsilon subunit [Streptomyces sp. NPDC001691]|uniref:acyl-CoA carboxylase epsilon subunit n=1 Tax=Streptomyces sp. NPDC001691 TaxID=3364600 RepID=UPI0036AAF11F
MTPTGTRTSTPAVPARTGTPTAIIVRGNPSREELAAVTAVLALARTANARRATTGPSRATWHRDHTPCTPVSWAAVRRTP